MRPGLPGKTVVITGASGGLGVGGNRYARGWSLDVRDLVSGPTPVPRW